MVKQVRSLHCIVDPNIERSVVVVGGCNESFLHAWKGDLLYNSHHSPTSSIQWDKVIAP